MKLRAIAETISPTNEEATEAVADLNNWSIQRSGKWLPNDYQELEKYLQKFEPPVLTIIANMLQLSSTHPTEMAFEITGEPGDESDYWRPEDTPKDATQLQQQKIESKLNNLSAGGLIDGGLADDTIPFMFVNNKLFMGDPNSFHDDLVNKYRPDDPDASFRGRPRGAPPGDYQALYDLYYKRSGGQLQGLVGRVGYGLDKIDPSLADASIACIYSHTGDAKTVQAAITQLLQGGYVKPDTYVNYAGLQRVSEIVRGGSAEASAEAKRKGLLQVALHLGAWPDGRRLDADEKRAIRQQLGMDLAGGAKHPWQQASEQSGLVRPGQKWWAPTSEDRYS